MRRILAIGVACAALMWTTAALAQDTSSQRNGNFGIGADQALNASIDGSVGTANGISGRYQLNDKIGLQAIFRLDIESGPGDDSSETQLNLGLRAIYNLVSVDNAAFGAVGGLTVLSRSVELAGNDSSSTGFNIEAGLRAEYFVTKSFSLHGEVGLVIALLGGEDGPVAQEQSPAGTTILIGSGDLLGVAGFTFWF